VKNDHDECHHAHGRYDYDCDCVILNGRECEEQHYATVK